MIRPSSRSAAFIVVAALAACVPPRERLDGASADGRTELALDLLPTADDSVSGAGVLHLAGRRRNVVVRGRWNDSGSGVRNLEATVQAPESPDERWALEWSPVSLNGSLRSEDGDALVALSAR